MKTALVFPGQGSQYVGMGFDFYSKFDVSKETFDNLDETLKFNLTNLIFNGDPNELSKTQNSQPSIMATSISIFLSLISENIIKNDSFHCVAGHSLGEYSALVANGSLKYKDSIELLKIRSQAMQESMPIGSSGMIALIGCSEKVAKESIFVTSDYGKLFIANDNADGQIVMSGDIGAINYLYENYKSLNIKRAIILPVSASFHCELMKNASIKMQDEIVNYEFNPFEVPLYSNVTSEICNYDSIKNLLVDQIISKVRWREILENMIRDGVQNFIEIGPGNVLTNLIRRVSKDVLAISVSKVEDMEKLAKIDL